MNLSAVNRFIGLDWRYPDNDCWAVFRDAALTVFGITVHEVSVPPEPDAAANAELFDRHAASPQWQRVEQPGPGCAVLCRDTHGHAVHIGLYIVDDNVLHCLGSPQRAGRTTYDPLRALRRLFPVIEFYRYAPRHRNT